MTIIPSTWSINPPASESRFRARFYFDPNSIAMANNDGHNILRAVQGSSGTLFYMLFIRQSDMYQVRITYLDDLLGYRSMSYQALSDAPHFIELDWQAGAGTGQLSLWIDGALRGSVANITNASQRVDSLVLGPYAGIDAGTRGTYFFDAFESRRASLIGGALADFSALPAAGTAPLSAQFTDQSKASDAITAYLWDFGDGSPLSTVANPLHTYTTEGAYTVRLTVTAGAHQHTTTKVGYINVAPLTDLIFADGFEDNNLSAWSSAVTDGGNLSASTAAAMLGSYGMAAYINDNNPLYVVDQSPSSRVPLPGALLLRSQLDRYGEQRGAQHPPSRAGQQRDALLHALHPPVGYVPGAHHLPG